MEVRLILPLSGGIRRREGGESGTDVFGVESNLKDGDTGITRENHSPQW